MHEFTGEYSPPPGTPLTLLQYFAKFLTNDTSNIIENINLYLVKKRRKSVNTDSEEMKTFLGMQILMGIVQVPCYEAYWSQEFCYLLADAMPLKRYEQL